MALGTVVRDVYADTERRETYDALVGYLDEDGYVCVLDRAKFAFESAGTTIYPAVFERALTSHPDVVCAAVVGIPDPELGHRICRQLRSVRERR